MNSPRTTAEGFLREMRSKIPLTHALGVVFTDFTPEFVRLTVPYEPNRNHVQTVFGGSLYAVGALSCYGLFRAMTEAHGFSEDFLVIQEGGIRYLKPVTKDFEVVATPNPSINIEKFIESVRKFGAGRLELQSEIRQDGETCAKFTGKYVLKR